LPLLNIIAAFCGWIKKQSRPFRQLCNLKSTEFQVFLKLAFSQLYCQSDIHIVDLPDESRNNVVKAVNPNDK